MSRKLAAGSADANSRATDCGTPRPLGKLRIIRAANMRRLCASETLGIYQFRSGGVGSDGVFGAWPPEFIPVALGG